jgi:putative aminopeptidase FrvX
MNHKNLFQTIAELVMCHSPSGVEEEVDKYILDRFRSLGVDTWQDRAGNIIAKIPGKNSELAIAITGHKDEIGAIVKSIDEKGCLQVRRLGGSFPWVYGEGVVDIIGDRQTVSGILCFGSRHVSHESPQKAQQDDKPLNWENAWVETKLNPQELKEKGIRPGSRVVVGKHRKQPIKLQDYIASYTLDNKASVAILLALAQQLEKPACDVYLVASAKEEVGAIGALYFTQNQKLDALIALEICPIAPEYPIESGEKPVLLSQDLDKAAEIAQIELQFAAISGFGSDASIAMKFGHVARAACLGFPTENTHGYEIAHLQAIANCVEILKVYCQQDSIADEVMH